MTTEYRGTASPVHANLALAPQLMTAMFRNTRSGVYGANRLPKSLARMAWNDAAYCIDAPDMMPAGACRRFELDAETQFAEQQHVERP
jgi:hypothetical protein